MYSAEDTVVLSGIVSDVKPEKLTSSVDSASTDDMTVTAIGIFTSFENVEVNSLNPAYKVSEMRSSSTLVLQLQHLL